LLALAFPVPGEQLFDALGRVVVQPREDVGEPGLPLDALITQMLKTVSSLAIYSQPPAIGQLLRPPHPHSKEDMIADVRMLGRLFALHAQRPYILKLES
jgi:hypothetical protein